MKYQNTKMLRLDCVKNGEISLGTDQNPEDSSKIVFAEGVLSLASNCSFLRIDHTEDSGKVLFVIAGVRL